MLGANIGYAMLANRYTHEYGLTDAQRAKVAVDQRTNANANPAAIFHAETLTIDDVLASEIIAEPLHMLEIVMPAAGAAALVVTSPERADDARQNRPGSSALASPSHIHPSLRRPPSMPRVSGELRDARWARPASNPLTSGTPRSTTVTRSWFC